MCFAVAYDLGAMERSPIRPEIDAFIDSTVADLATLSGKSAEAFRSDVIVEAANLTAAIVDADGRATDDELWAYTDGVGRLLSPPIIDTPDRLRGARVTKGKATWVRSPSTLFDLLARADARDGGARTHAYYLRALAIAHGVAAVDLMPSPQEIAAIDTFRSTLLAAMDVHGVPRPGTVRPTGGSGTTAPSGPASVTGGPSYPASDGPGADGAGSHDPGASFSGRAGGEGPTATPGEGSTRGPSAHAAGATGASARGALDPTPPRSLEDLLAELDGLVGLATVKAEVRRLTSMLQVARLRQAKGLSVFETSHHLVFTGNPGTGKTTVARLLSQIYRALGVVSKGHLVETDRSALVAGFVGQTATKTAAALESALGGTLLIDEAYALARGGDNDFGREAIDTLVKFMEDHRDDFAAIAAGYPEEMTTFIDANPGLKSRFTRTLNFADYTVDELVEIFANLGEKHQYRPSDGALAVVRAMIASEPRNRGFGNARYVRNLFEAAVARQAGRVAALDEPDAEQLSTLVATDIVAPEE